MKKSKLKIDRFGNRHYYYNGLLHREDGPAIVYSSGDIEYWINGNRHRENGPALEYKNGHKEWWINGKRHREDGAAVEYADGHEEWWENDELIFESKTPHSKMTNLNSFELLDKLTSAIKHYYNQDKIAPGLVCSKLSDKQCYVSIARYLGFEKNKTIVVSSIQETYEKALKDVSKQFLKIVQSKIDNPIDKLEEYIKN